MDLIEVWLKDPLKHWYYRHKFAAIKREAKLAIDLKSIVDIGAGSAIFSRELLKLNNEVQVQAVDIGYEYEGIDRNEIRINYSRTCTNYDADLFLLTDVLEHVEDDYNFLNLIVSKANLNPSRIGVTTAPIAGITSLYKKLHQALKTGKTSSRITLKMVPNAGPKV